MATFEDRPARCGSVKGFFEITDPELIALVESNEVYGAQILQID